MKAAVIGGAGFIGSHLVDQIVARGGTALVIDDMSVGKRAFIAGSLDSGKAELVELQVSDDRACVERLAELFAGLDTVFHLAANPEARWGLQDTHLDLRQNTLTTWAALDACRRAGVKQMMLASSGTVYGEADNVTYEDQGPILPISLYGASKVASEALVSAYASCFHVDGYIYRFGNVVGPRGTHGAALDFIKQLEKDTSVLTVLGDGSQAKPYLHVDDCVGGILHGIEHNLAGEKRPLSYFNIAPPNTTSVREIAETVVAEMGLEGTTKIHYTGGDRGWPGDVPKSRMNPEKLAATGFRVRYTSNEALARAISELVRERRDLPAGHSKVD